MTYQLKLTPRQQRYGCGIYEAGDTEKCYVQLFVTDSGRVIPITGRTLSAESLMEAYVWGRLDAEANAAVITGLEEDEYPIGAYADAPITVTDEAIVLGGQMTREPAAPNTPTAAPHEH